VLKRIRIDDTEALLLQGEQKRAAAGPDEQEAAPLPSYAFVDLE
jgi:hypothetical protein